MVTERIRISRMACSENLLSRKYVLQWIVLTAVIGLAAILRFANLDALGYANHYYAAAVKSMLQSPHNFFFVAAEPGGSVSVDKPPVGLWLQALSAYFLGVNGFALLLPQLLAGMISVVVIYHLVRRRFGFTAGWLAALALAITPVVVATDRNNTMDSVLILTLLLAAWAFIKATETGRFPHLMLGAFLVGLGFNIKMLQAVLPLPAFYALYFLGSSERAWRKVGKLILASFLLIMVSLSWSVIVDLTPADLRPYVGSSGNNSETNLILGYNGINRLLGMIRQRGNPPPGRALQTGSFPPSGSPPVNIQAPGSGQSRPEQTIPIQPNPGLPASQQPGFRQANPGLPNPGQPNPWQNPGFPAGRLSGSYAGLLFQGVPGNARNPFPGGNPPGNPGNRMSGTGTPGALRLFVSPLSKEASWLLPFGLFSVVLLSLRARLRWPVTPRHQAVVLWGGWLLVAGIFFSVAGFFHEYYLSMLAPPLAALMGIGATQLWRMYQVRAWWVVTLSIAVTSGTLGFQVITARSFVEKVTWLPVLLALFTLGSLLVIASNIRPRLRRMAMTGYVCLIASTLVTPGIWSALTTLYSSENQSLPAAYGGHPSGPANRGDLHVNRVLLDYLQANTQEVKYLIAMPSSMQGADYVLATGRPVLYMGGFNGQDQVVYANDLEEMLSQGELRYIYWDAREGGFGNRSDISSWIAASCQVVPGFDTTTRNAGAPGGTLPSQPGLANQQAGQLMQGLGTLQIALYDCTPKQ
jgi:4-amino-4-deoxy-L-arabinose transferase-like glycosyltransferase